MNILRKVCVRSYRRTAGTGINLKKAFSPAEKSAVVHILAGCRRVAGPVTAASVAVVDGGGGMVRRIYLEHVHFGCGQPIGCLWAARDGCSMAPGGPAIVSRTHLFSLRSGAFRDGLLDLA